MIVGIILTILVLTILFIIYRKTRSYRAKVHFNPNGQVEHLVSQMTSLEKPYKPTWWLIGPNIHTIMGMRYRKKSRMECRRELIVFEDGGTSALDWFESKEAKEDTPIVIIIHTLAGGTREPCSNNLAEALVQKGFRAVVANNRCCSGAPITSAKYYDLTSSADIEFTVKHIREEFKPKFLFIAGFSLGGYIAIQYACANNDIDGFACISHTMDSVKAAKVIETPIKKKLYTAYMMSKLKHLIKKNKFINCPEVQKATTLTQFDDILTCKLLGFKDYIEYYSTLRIYDKIPRVNMPGLLLSADDDPFTDKKYLPIKETEESQLITLVHYPEGGHVSFLTGNDAQASQIDIVIPEWFETIMKDKTK